MNKYLILLLLFISINLYAQETPDWENPKVYAINKENTRATSIPYANQNQALNNEYQSSSYYQSLNGLWKFKWVPKVVQTPKDFFKIDFDDKQWATMPVPGTWEFNGFGTPIYVSEGFGFKPNPPFIDRDDSPVGAYRRAFTVNDSWKGRRVMIHFEGGTNAMYVWVNGQKVGYTENSKSPAEFDITAYLKPGVNTLACEVHKFSDGYYLEDQDMWRMGGINRNVYLYSTAQTRILDFFAHPTLDATYKNGLFDVDLTLKNYSKKAEQQTIEVLLMDNSNHPVFKKQSIVALPAEQEANLNLSGMVPAPLKWTAETPNLYNMVLVLKNSSGEVIEATSHQVGFRKIEIKDGQVFINGKKIYFKGVNLHEFNSQTGQVVSEEVMMRNIQLMKELNINAVRTSHYPQPPLWYKLCDKYGIYLVDEANLESHGLGYGPENVSNFPEWHDAHLDRMVRLVERDKNHASVIFWSLGNEASNGKAFFDLYDWAKKRDQSRPVQYEQAHQKDRNTDVICPMYPSWESMTRDAKKDLGRPYIMCEYAHAMGNSMGNFQDYWDLMRSSKNMQGGFIWEWYNHGFKTVDEQGRAYWAYGGDLNGYQKMNSENFCMDGIISPDQQYLPHTPIVKKVYQNILFKPKDISNGVITVINDFKFTDLTAKNYNYKWVLLKNGAEVAQGKFNVTIPADAKKDVKLALPKMEKQAGVEYFLQVFAYTRQANQFIPIGFEVAKEEFAFESNHYFEPVETTAGEIITEEKADKIIIKANQVAYEFSQKNGQALLKMSKDGKNVFNELPRLNFWRAPTDNEFGEGAQRSLRLWEAAGYNVIYNYKETKKSDQNVSISYVAKLRGIEAVVNLTYTVKGDGSLTVAAAYQALADDLPEMMRFGMLMNLSGDHDQFTWYGRGPGENYVDRNADSFMKIWNGKVKDQLHSYYRPQESGNKTDTRWLRLLNKEGKGVEIIGLQPLSVSATNNLPEDLDPGLTKKQQHASDVVPNSDAILSVDLFQRGVGGLNSWGAKPLNKYRFLAKAYNYVFVIRPL